MSQENVEALRRLYTAWAKGNLWVLQDIADPAIEWEWSDRMASLFGGPRTYRGLRRSARPRLSGWRLGSPIG